MIPRCWHCGEERDLTDHGNAARNGDIMIESGDIKLEPTCHDLTNVIYKGRLIGIVGHSDYCDEAPYMSQTTNLSGQSVHWHHDNIEQAVGWIIRTADPFNHATEYTKA